MKCNRSNKSCSSKMQNWKRSMKRIELNSIRIRWLKMTLIKGFLNYHWISKHLKGKNRSWRSNFVSIATYFKKYKWKIGTILIWLKSWAQNSNWINISSSLLKTPIKNNESKTSTRNNAIEHILEICRGLLRNLRINPIHIKSRPRNKLLCSRNNKKNCRHKSKNKDRNKQTSLTNKHKPKKRLHYHNNNINTNTINFKIKQKLRWKWYLRKTSRNSSNIKWRKVVYSQSYMINLTTLMLIGMIYWRKSSNWKVSYKNFTKRTKSWGNCSKSYNHLKSIQNNTRNFWKSNHKWRKKWKI